MTFTFVTNPFNDIARIRFAIGDTDSTAPIFTDEILDGLIVEHDDWQHAAIAAVKNIITQLLMPNFTADWLKVDSDAAVRGYERLLARLQSEYDTDDGAISLGVVMPTRIDADDEEDE